MCLWYEYPIPADYKKQREIIRHLRKWIKGLESRGIVEGYAFNHYYPTSAALNLRFDCSDKGKLETVRKELNKEMKNKLLSNNMASQCYIPAISQQLAAYSLTT